MAAPFPRFPATELFLRVPEGMPSTAVPGAGNRARLLVPSEDNQTNKICSSVTTALEKEEEEGRTNLHGQRFSARSVHRRSLSWEEPIIAGQAS